MRIMRRPYRGRLVGLAVDGEHVLAHYGDLVGVLPNAWGDALPRRHRISVQGQVYADPKHLKPLTETDLVDEEARKALSHFLHQLPALAKDKS